MNPPGWPSFGPALKALDRHAILTLPTAAETALQLLGKPEAFSLQSYLEPYSLSLGLAFLAGRPDPSSAQTIPFRPTPGLVPDTCFTYRFAWGVAMNPEKPGWHAHCVLQLALDHRSGRLCSVTLSECSPADVARHFSLSADELRAGLSAGLSEHISSQERLLARLTLAGTHLAACAA